MSYIRKSRLYIPVAGTGTLPVNIFAIYTKVPNLSTCPHRSLISKVANNHFAIIFISNSMVFIACYLESRVLWIYIIALLF